MDFNGLLNLMLEQRASDLFITADVQPSLKINGQIRPIGKTKLTATMIAQLLQKDERGMEACCSTTGR